MPKAGELSYYRMIGEESRRFAVRKPFSLGQIDGPSSCGEYLLAFGGVCQLLRPSPSRLLDMGCGTGWTSGFFAKMGYDVVGQDIAADAVSLANGYKAAERLSNVSFITSDYESLDFENEFENAVFFDSLHHAVDERLALESTFRALKPGGVCVTREPGTGHAEAEHSLHAVEHYGVTEKDMPPSHIAKLAFEIGFSQVNIYPFPNDAFRTLCRPRSARHTELPTGLRGWWKRIQTSYSSAVRIAKLTHNVYERGGLVQLVK